MIIPKQFGGLGFSALAHSEVVTKLTTRSGTAAVSVMVPNSLGPAELLLHYGTDAQKNYYLPRLAKGLEMPCFALTSPEAGSDAGGIPDFGIVCRAEWEGQPTCWACALTWEKRYITLGPIATLLGLAFRLYDPDAFLGKQDDVGITLALIPTNTPGVQIGRRHLPLNAVFMNGPNWGKDVFIPMDCVIGGVDYVGQGGDADELPCRRALDFAARQRHRHGEIVLRDDRRVRTHAHAVQNAGRPFRRRRGSDRAHRRPCLLMEAARVMTAGAIDLGEKPSVVSAIVKYHLTELARIVMNDAMDVHGGKGICMGPSNYLAAVTRACRSRSPSKARTYSRAR